MNFLVFALIAGGVGLALTHYMVDTGSPLTTRHIGPWSIWTAAGRDDADPYTRAHFIRIGALPLSSRIARIYQARSDANSQQLRSNCDYAIEGVGPDAQWWNLAVYTDKGMLIANPANRHSFTSSTIMRKPDNSYRIILAREARAGNWLPTVRANKLMLVLRVQQPHYGTQPGRSALEAKELPTISKLTCR